MLTLRRIGMLLAMLSAGYGQPVGNKPAAPRSGSDRDEAAIRSLLAEGYETRWNNHHPAPTADTCVDDAIFINITGGWVKGRENFAEMITRLHAPGGIFHEHTRRHMVEELRLIRRDVAIAVVKTFDIKRAGVPTTGEETRGLIVLTKEDGRWKVNALENTTIQATGSGQR
jgi:uncharacterized protein (TIGR02246 family)